MKEKIKVLLAEHEFGFSYEPKDNIDSFFFTADLENGVVRGLIAANNEENQIMIHVNHPANIPEPKRRIVSELLARINYDDLFGGFVMDLSDGSLGYQCGFLFEEGSPHSEKVLERYFETSYYRVDYYLPSILKVAFGDKEPALVLNELEHEVDPRLN